MTTPTPQIYSTNLRGPRVSIDVGGELSADIGVGGTSNGELLLDNHLPLDSALNSRHGTVVLLTGLLGSGKSTIARALTSRLNEAGITTTLLDGNEVRQQLSLGLGFDQESREINLNRIGFVAALIAKHGGVVVCSQIAPFDASRRRIRRMAQGVGAQFLLVYISTPLAVCEARDRKGLYAKARAGEIQHFTGISSPYEVPDNADLVINTPTVSIAQAVEQICGLLAHRSANIVTPPSPVFTESDSIAPQTVTETVMLPRWRRDLNRTGNRTLFQIVKTLKATEPGRLLVAKVKHIAEPVPALGADDVALNLDLDQADITENTDESADVTAPEPNTPPIVALISTEAPSHAVRFSAIAKEAEKLGLLTARRASAYDIATGLDTTLYSVVLVARNGVDPELLTELRTKIATTNARLVIDLDDDMITPGARDRLLNRSNYTSKSLDSVIELCQAANQIIVSTKPLAQITQEITTTPIAVFPNMLDPDIWTAPVASRFAPDGRVRLLYYGTSMHDADLELLKELPKRLSEMINREVVIELMGVTNGKVPPGFFALFPSEFPYQEFAEYLRNQRGRWSVGLAPLMPDDFNAGKSDLKLLEYAALGIPAVASRVGPYQEADELAVVVDNTPEAWATAVARLLTDTAFARDRVTTAQQNVFRNRLVTENAARRWAQLVLGEYQHAE